MLTRMQQPALNNMNLTSMFGSGARTETPLNLSAKKSDQQALLSTIVRDNGY